ncbi:hypothetical protein ACOME3_010446 [Neoechinorhynchus agilis]
MQGIDGRYFRRNHSTKEVDLLIPDTLDRSIRTQILRFIQCGYLHSLLIESVNGIDRSSLMWQAFSLYIREELNVYHAHLGTIEKFLPKEGNGLFITQLHMCLLEPLNRLKALAALCDVVEKSKTEESLLTTLYRFAQFGSRLFEDIGNSALRICCLPMYRSIYEWMIRGSLRESFHDFFIEQENSNYDEHGLGDDEEFEWNKKFTVCEQLIPCFISEDQINKIFVAGKSVYFLRNVCKAWSASSLISQINPEITQEDVHSIYDQSDLKFSKFIETSYTNAASNLLRVLSTDYKMRKHFRNIKDYILLGQGDFIRLLMDLVRVELNQSAVKVRIHTLRAALQSAFRFTTTEYGDDEHDCSNMVDIRLFGANHGELGWDIFSLDYNITGPLLTVFPESTRLKYLRIFNFMWRLRRVEFTLGFLWKDLMSLNRKFKVRDESVAKIFQLVNLTCSLVLHFISQMNGYMFQVLESSWHDFFFTQLPHAQDLSEVIASNNEFIQQAFSKLALRSDDLTTGDDELNKYILEALSTCLDFEGTVRKLIKITSSETSENRNILAALRILSDEINSHVSDMKENIDSLIRLARRPCCDIGLKFLIFRLNFNDFYRRSYDM